MLSLISVSLGNRFLFCPVLFAFAFILMLFVFAFCLFVVFKKNILFRSRSNGLLF